MPVKTGQITCYITGTVYLFSTGNIVLDSGCIMHYSDLIRPMAVRLVPVLNSGLEIMSEADPLLSYFRCYDQSCDPD